VSGTIGHDPWSELFAGQLRADAVGYLLAEPPSSRTAVEGVLASAESWNSL
jgi:thioredoxin reductase (NADPH)